MSDGPHRSLPMRKAWKEVAKRADELAYDSDQVSEATQHAVTSDFRNEVSYPLLKALKNVFSGRDNSLGLPEISLHQLEDTKALAAGSVFGTSMVSWCIQLVHEGRLDMDAFHEAVGLAAKQRCFANTRSVEEHYERASNPKRARGVGARLSAAISELSERKLGSMLVDPQTPYGRRLGKRTDVNDGVPF